MNRTLRILAEAGLAASLAGPAVFAQKPPTPAPPPVNPPSGSTRPTSPFPTPSQPGDPSEDFVLFVMGKVATDDGSNLPTNVMVERVCKSTVRQQVYASPEGDFSMQLGSVNDSTLDASAEGNAQTVVPNKFSESGIPRRLLQSCDLRVSAAGFESPTMSLLDADSSGKALQVGTIRVHRRAKVSGATVNAAAYKGAPQGAITAYEKGLEAERTGKLANAQKHFEKAVEIHPKYAHAWFELGRTLQREDDREGARSAYKRAAGLDERFLAPHLALASLAAQDGNWPDVLSFTDPILALDPFKTMTGFTMELDQFNYGETYYYNAVANYQLQKFDEAQKSAVKAEQLFARAPQLHLLLGDIYERKNNNDSAISELKTYLELMPNANNADQVRARLTRLEHAQSAAPAGPKNDKN